MKKFCPELGQQVFVQYLETPLIPVIFAGWCVDRRFRGLKTNFTLVDGSSRRQFILHSPEVISISLDSIDGDCNLTKRNPLKKDRDLNRSIFYLKAQLVKANKVSKKK